MDTVIFSLSLFFPSTHTTITEHIAMCVFQALNLHAQHCVSSKQARTTAVPGSGSPELKLCWMEVVLYKVSMGFKNGMFVSAALHINF